MIRLLFSAHSILVCISHLLLSRKHTVRPNIRANIYLSAGERDGGKGGRKCETHNGGKETDENEKDGWEMRCQFPWCELIPGSPNILCFILEHHVAPTAERAKRSRTQPEHAPTSSTDHLKTLLIRRCVSTGVFSDSGCMLILLGLCRFNWLISPFKFNKPLQVNDNACAERSHQARVYVVIPSVHATKLKFRNPPTLDSQVPGYWSVISCFIL